MYLAAALGAHLWAVFRRPQFPNEHDWHGCMQGTIELVCLHGFQAFEASTTHYVLSFVGIVRHDIQTNGRQWGNRRRRRSKGLSVRESGARYMAVERWVRFELSLDKNSTNVNASIERNKSREHVTSDNMCMGSKCPEWRIYRSSRQRLAKVINGRGGNGGHGTRYLSPKESRWLYAWSGVDEIPGAARGLPNKFTTPRINRGHLSEWRWSTKMKKSEITTDPKRYVWKDWSVKS